MNQNTTDARAETIPLVKTRPEPILLRVAHSRRADGVETSISKIWRGADVVDGRAPDGCLASLTPDGAFAVSLIVVRGYVSGKDARSFRPARFVPGGVKARGLAAVNALDHVGGGVTVATGRPAGWGA